MPKALERRLAHEASKKHLTGRRRGAYIYGTLAKIKLSQERSRERGKKRKTAKKHRH